MSDAIDSTRLTLLLNELRLPALKQIWSSFAERSDKEGWPAARLIMALAEHELAERDRRRIERHLGEARLLPGKTLENFDFDAVPMISKAQVARRELALEAAISRLDRFDLVILDDFAYVTKDQAETSVLFELISARYEQRSLLITANQPFGEWGKVFPDPAMTLAAVDRLVHHSTIFELNVESYRRRTALQRKQEGPGRPASFATPRNAGRTRRDKPAAE
ncbi:ATP-binding protein [Azohydromonas lata]|uniref:ATP-binding protein n=1 Tax=Azohydromonas lata TaxID=45677 RepID=A0ABU5IDD5_9BURK|nr:ATP-binding protein [Azohydromonas lata]MDZ5455973.1 ATP-binding protein [Azohydromonas lata]